jgi:hypothetical protein
MFMANTFTIEKSLQHQAEKKPRNFGRSDEA